MIVAMIIVLKPYETFQERRVGTSQIQILVEYVNVTGDPGCTKLYLLKSKSTKKSDLAIFPAVPKIIQSPDDGEYAYDGNNFKLTGYPYEWVFHNLITGEERSLRSPRFDVVKWEINVPYTVWSEEQGEDGEPLTEKRSLPLTFEFKMDDQVPVIFKMNNYVDCLAGQ